ncbi:MAG: glycine--tRNA ligase subunit beta [Thermodesulfobacteriota bacterium]
MAHELLFEIGTEEIPAGYLMPALNSLQDNLARRLGELGLSFGETQTAATPRRLAICVRDLAERQPDRVEEVLGPPKKAGFDVNGQPTKAAIGFAQSRGVAMEAIEVVATPKGEYLMVRVEQPGKPTAELLREVLPELVPTIPFPKSMRWGCGRLHFARPIQWLLARYSGQVVSFQLETLTSGGHTHGHRFMAPQAMEPADFDSYLDCLRAAHILADPAERREAVRAEIAKAAASIGGRILPDEELIDTVTNLVEKPHAICGTFEERFLALPREVLITSMREHQKYFAVVDAQGKLMPHFVAVNNTRVKDPVLGADGHQRVIRARLEDAFFFFKEDQHRTLADRVADLSGVIFQSRLGTMAEKTSRVVTLAGELASAIAPELTETVKRAALLAKTDLLTSMVGEFPTLQGSIGRDYALLNGEPPAVATAIAEHYLPLRAGGDLPQELAGTVVGIADRLDTLAGYFGIGQKPTGTADPFGLRRQALGLLALIQGKNLALPLSPWLDRALGLYECQISEPRETAKANVLEFLKGRFLNDLTAQGLPVEAVEAVVSVEFDDVVDCRRRIEALIAINTQPAFALLAGSFKRVNNIIKENVDTRIDEALLAEAAERGLFASLRTIEAEAMPLLTAREYGQALAVILKMKEPIDTFFDQVMVMAEDAALRRNRLALLTAIAGLFRRVGDFSKMYALNQQGS